VVGGEQSTECSAVQCRAVQCSAVQCSAVQCSAVQCSAVQCSAVQCSAVLVVGRAPNAAIGARQFTCCHAALGTAQFVQRTLFLFTAQFAQIRVRVHRGAARCRGIQSKMQVMQHRQCSALSHSAFTVTVQSQP
jgi:hypothetical protein